MNEKAIEAAARVCRDKYCELLPGKRRWSELTDQERYVDVLCLKAALFALPPLRAREEIARIIDPVAFEVQGTWMELPSNAESRQNALQKADAILSRPAGQEWRDISSVAFPCAACGKIISRSPTSWCGQCNQPIFPAPPAAEPKVGDVSRETLASSPDAPVVSRS